MVDLRSTTTVACLRSTTTIGLRSTTTCSGLESRTAVSYGVGVKDDGRVLKVNGCDRTTLKMRDLSSKIISGDSR
jgi:hypothetical protein